MSHEVLDGLTPAVVAAKPEVKAWCYTLRTEEGAWLAQVVLTNDGMFASVSDWGNFSYAWRAFGQKDGVDFRDFILKLNPGYFSEKMYIGMNYVVSTRKVEKACDRFAMMILPALKQAILEEVRA
jgi:hypothetical protein